MPVLEKTRSPYVLVVGLTVAAALLIFAGVHLFSHDDVEVRVAPVGYQNLISSVSTNGKVEPVEEFQAHAFGPGEVKKIFVQIGQKVQRGQMLLQMDDADAAARVASMRVAVQSSKNSAADLQQNGTQEERIALAGEVERAQFQEQQATSDLQALEQLRQKGAASAAEVAAAQQRLQTAQSALRGVEQRRAGRFGPGDIARSKTQVADASAGLAAAQANYNHNDIRAPLAGTVYSIPVAPYDFVSTGEDLMDVADLNRIQVRAYFDEPEIGKLAVGQAVRIVWEARPGQTWHGHIERAPSTIITYGTRNVGECIITVDDANGDLLPNTNVTVTVITKQRFNVLCVPREGLHTEGAINFVYKVVNGRLVHTPVQVGVVNLTRVEITSGLTDHDTVALGATSNRDLSNGLAVRTVE